MATPMENIPPIMARLCSPYICMNASFEADLGVPEMNASLLPAIQLKKDYLYEPHRKQDVKLLC
jgi:hypothetical protein